MTDPQDPEQHHESTERGGAPDGAEDPTAHLEGSTSGEPAPPGGPIPPWAAPPAGSWYQAGHPGPGSAGDRPADGQAPPWAQGGQGGQWGPPPGYGGYGGSGYGGPSYGQWGQPPQQPSRSSNSSSIALVLVVAILVVAAAGVGAVVGHHMHSNSTVSASNYPQTQPGSGTGTGGASSGPSDVNSIAAKVAPALVDVNVTFNYQSAEGAGTGIVLTKDGEILTNNHVIDGATSISVTDVGNNKTYKASVVGYDPTHDIALLKAANASNLTTAKIGDSGKISVGQQVVGIGNAGGSGGIPSSAGGTIVALNQSISAGDELDGSSEQLSNLIQTNADIQSGDSGGSLVNTSGVVIGMDTAASEGFSFGGQSSGGGGQGYAIPINQAMATVKNITSNKGSSTLHIGPTAFLGVTVSSAGGCQSSEGSGGTGGSSGGSGGFGGSGSGGSSGGFGGSSGSEGGSGSSGQSNAPGAEICTAISGGAAAAAKLAPGDTITAVNSTKVQSPSTLSHLFVPYHPGQKINLTYTDTSGQSHTISVTLGSGPAS